jgi:hypothetical protein
MRILIFLLFFFGYTQAHEISFSHFKLEPQILSLIQHRQSFEVAGQPLAINNFQLEPIPSRQEIQAKWQMKGIGLAFLVKVK